MLHIVVGLVLFISAIILIRLAVDVLKGKGE